MTIDQAKDYVYAQLPCTMRSLEAMMHRDIDHLIRVDSIVGLAPGSIGYTRIVVKLTSRGFQHTDPAKAWFERLGFKLHSQHVSVNGMLSWWFNTHVEIKEDRGKPPRLFRLPHSSKSAWH